MNGIDFVTGCGWWCIMIIEMMIVHGVIDDYGCDDDDDDYAYVYDDCQSW